MFKNPFERHLDRLTEVSLKGQSTPFRHLEGLEDWAVLAWVDFS